MLTVADMERLDAECRRLGYDTAKIVGMAKLLPRLRFYRFCRRPDGQGLSYEIAGVWNPRKNSKIYNLEVI